MFNLDEMDDNNNNNIKKTVKDHALSSVRFVSSSKSRVPVCKWFVVDFSGNCKHCLATGLLPWGRGYHEVTPSGTQFVSSMCFVRCSNL